MIDVLLATHDPNAAWLDAQVESIRGQRGVDVRLIVREDEGGQGPCGNFNALLKMSTCDYAAFADQDDVWDKDKLATMMARMEDMEGTLGKDMPVLVFCDSYVVDEDLKRLDGTFLSRRGIDVKHGVSLARLLMQNFIPGHAMLFNAALRDKAGGIPDAAIMHDYWMALVAAAFGRIGFVDKPLVLYRQHVRNVLSVNSSSRSLESFRTRLRKNIEQAEAFLERFGDECPPCARALANIEAMTWLGRRMSVVRHGLFKQGLWRNLVMMVVI